MNTPTPPASGVSMFDRDDKVDHLERVRQAAITAWEQTAPHGGINRKEACRVGMAAVIAALEAHEAARAGVGGLTEAQRAVHDAWADVWQWTNELADDLLDDLIKLRDTMDAALAAQPSAAPKGEAGSSWMIRAAGVLELVADGATVIPEQMQQIANNLMAMDAAPKAEGERRLVGYGDCKCVMQQFCDGKCNPIFQGGTTTQPARASDGGGDRPPGTVGEMTPGRAIYFLQRFKRDEKMLGPHEQWALDFAIAALSRPPLAAAVGDAVNVSTHRYSWRAAIERMIGAPHELATDRSYWEHELAAFDRTFDRLEAIASQAGRGG